MIDFFLHPVQLSTFAHKYVKLSTDIRNQYVIIVHVVSAKMTSHL